MKILCDTFKIDKEIGCNDTIIAQTTINDPWHSYLLKLNSSYNLMVILKQYTFVPLLYFYDNNRNGSPPMFNVLTYVNLWYQ